MSEWISIEDKWPPNGRDYLVAYKSDQYTIIKVAEADGYVEHDGIEMPHWKGIMGNGPNVTHWMPLPEPPSCP